MAVPRIDGGAGVGVITANTTDGTATAAADYTAVVATDLDWIDGDCSTQYLDVIILGDSVAGGTFNINWTAATPAIIAGGCSTTVVTIPDPTP